MWTGLKKTQPTQQVIGRLSLFVVCGPQLYEQCEDDVTPKKTFELEVLKYWNSQKSWGSLPSYRWLHQLKHEFLGRPSWLKQRRSWRSKQKTCTRCIIFLEEFRCKCFFLPYSWKWNMGRWDDFSLQGVISSPLIMEGKAIGMMYLFATRILKHRVLSMAMVATISQRHQFDVIVWD